MDKFRETQALIKEIVELHYGGNKNTAKRLVVLTLQFASELAEEIQQSSYMGTEASKQLPQIYCNHAERFFNETNHEEESKAKEIYQDIPTAPEEKEVVEDIAKELTRRQQVLSRIGKENPPDVIEWEKFPEDMRNTYALVVRSMIEDGYIQPGVEYGPDEK